MKKADKAAKALGKQYVEFFNKYRNAGIKDICSSDNELVFRYLDGRDIPITIKNVKTWVQLFDVLDKLHPSIKKYQKVSK